MAKQTALEKLAGRSTAAFERHEKRIGVHFEILKAVLVDDAGRHLDWNIFDGLLEVPASLSAQMASQFELVVEDSRRTLLNDPIFANWLFKKEGTSKSSARSYSNRKITDSNHAARYGEETEEEWVLPQRHIDLEVGGLWFRLAGFKVRETKLTLLFEDRVAAILREEKGQTITHDRGAMTRAGFVAHLIRMAAQKHRKPIRYFIPEEKIKQPEAEPTVAESATDLKNGSARALSTNSGVTVKGQPATQAQLQILNEALEAAVEAKAPFKAQVALVAALIDENDCSKPNPLQLEPFWSSINHEDVPSVSKFFLEHGFGSSGGAIAIARATPHLSPGEIAQLVQASGAGAPTNGRGTYGKFQAEAEHAVKAFGAIEGGGSSEGMTRVKTPYAFTRGPEENTWDCIQRLASEVSWYAFVRNNAVWFVSGDYLLAQEPRMFVVEGENGVDWVEPNVELGARDGLAEVVVRGRSRPWVALPGEAVTVGRMGPINGKWVVDSIQLDALDRSDAITIKLLKPLPARPEPASSGTIETPSGEGTEGANPQSALAVFNAASLMSSMGPPYVRGGGHGSNGIVEPQKGYDCSGSTCWALKQGGMFPGNSAQVSGELESWGQAGRGKEMTVWARADHVFIEFTIPGHERAQFNTDGPQNGPRLYTVTKNPTYSMNPWAEGYVARHWPGT